MKIDQPYRPIRGLNMPYDKIPDEMGGFVFRDMRSSDEIEAAIYQLWDRLTMREIEAAFHALKRLSDLPPTSLMDRLAQKTIELSDAITGRNMSSIFLAASRFKYFNASLFNCLAKEAMKEEKLQEFPGVFCGTIVYAMGALQRYFMRNRDALDQDMPLVYFPLQFKLLETLVHRVLFLRDEAGFTNKNIANFSYGLAMMHFRNVSILNVLAEEACRPERLSIYNEQEVSNMIYSFGILQFRHDRLLSNFCEILRHHENLRQWTEQGLSNMLYGFASLEYQPPKETMFALIWEVCRETRLQRFYNQHLMNVMYGFSSLGVTSYRVFKLLLDELLSRRHKFTFMLTGLASIVYSFAKAGVYTDRLKIVLQDLTSDINIGKLTNFSMSNLLRAYGMLPDESELVPYLTKLMKEAIRGERLSRYTEIQFAQMILGLGTSHFQTRLDPICVSYLVQGATVSGFLPKYTNQGLANLIYGLVHLGYIDRETHDRLSEEMLKRIPSCEGITLSSILYAWSTIPYKNNAIFFAVKKRLTEKDAVKDFTEHVLGNLLFALLRMEIRDPELFLVLTRRIEQEDIWPRFVYITAPVFIRLILTSEFLDFGFRHKMEQSLNRILQRGEGMSPQKSDEADLIARSFKRKQWEYEITDDDLLSEFDHFPPTESASSKNEGNLQRNAF